MVHKHIRQSLKDSFFSGRTIATVFSFLLIFKQIAIYFTYGQQIEANRFNTILIYLGFIGNDLMLLGIILLLIFASINTKFKAIRRTAISINIFLLLLFFVDIITIYLFQSRLSIFELYSFFSASNGGVFFGYIATDVAIFISLCIIGFFFTQKYFKHLQHKTSQKILAIRFFCITLIICGIGFFAQNNTELSENILALNIQTFKQHRENQDMSFLKTAKNYEDYFTTIKGKNQKRNIILVFAESFSTVDSKRAGGLYNNFPLLDKIQSQGITYTNFLANGCTSETSHIALLQGVEPRENPLMNSEQAYDTYATPVTPLPQFFNTLGYQTTFLSTVTLDFLNEKNFLSGIHFTTVIGEEAFTKDKKYVFGAAPDQSLYNKALDLAQTYKTQKKPYFLAMQTISSHRPYDTPYGQESADMFRYVDRSIYAFYQKLKQNWFFDNGLLVIVGDHRKMEAIDKDEFNRFGMSSHSRAVATIIGKDIKPNTINNNIIQHTDISNTLKVLAANTGVLISKLYNNAITNQTQRDRGVRYCRFAEKTYAIVKKDGTSYRLDAQKDIPIQNYINAFKRYEAEQLLGLQNFTGYHAPALNTGKDISNDYTIIAHAGGAYGGRIPNAYNTVERARRDGADGVEFDISYTKDNQNVIIHGPSLESTTCGINKTITGYDLKDLQKNCKLKNGEKILTLEDFLKKIKGQFKYYFLEIKVYDQSKAEQQTLAAIETVLKLGMEKEVVFISYDRIANYIIGSHKKIRAGRDSYYTGETKLIYDFPHEFYLIDKSLVEQDTAEISRAMNKKLVIYTVNKAEDFEKLSLLGIKAVMTDNPPALKALAKRKSTATK